VPERLKDDGKAAFERLTEANAAMERMLNRVGQQGAAILMDLYRVLHIQVDAQALGVDADADAAAITFASGSLLQRFSLLGPSEHEVKLACDRVSCATESLLQTAPPSTLPRLRVTRCVGAQDLKSPLPLVSSEASVVRSDAPALASGGQRRWLVLVSDAVSAVLSDDEIAREVDAVGARPKAASLGIVQAASKASADQNNASGDGNLSAIAMLLAPTDSASAPPPAKKAKTDAKNNDDRQVRVRHILLRHRPEPAPGAKAPAAVSDPVRRKPVKRDRAAAEIEAHADLQRILAAGDDAARSKAFTKLARDRSECQSCLKAGDMAGDLGWLKIGENHKELAPNSKLLSLVLVSMS